MYRHNIFEVVKEDLQVDIFNEDRTITSEDSYKIEVGTQYKTGSINTCSLGELTKSDLIEIRNKINKIIGEV